MEALIEKYIEIRDAKQEIVNKHKAKIAKLDKVLDKIEAFILEQFNEDGVESARCSSGTAYKSVRASCGVADWDTTLAYIREHDLWNMLEKRVNKTAVEEFRDAQGDLPPGLNWREEVTINVRRSN